MTVPTIRIRLLAEAVGTAWLVLVGCGAIALDALELLRLGVPGIALAFGLAVCTGVAFLGPLSGAHMNPAVTVAMRFRGRMTTRMALGYVVAQCVGALAGAGILRALVGPGRFIGATLPAPGVPMWSAGLMEAAATGLLVAVILVVATGRRLPAWVPPIAIGATVGLAAWLIGPPTGASLNPARSLGPAALDGLSATWLVLPLYVVAPVAGAVAVAWLVCTLLPDDACCVSGVAKLAVGTNGADLVPVPVADATDSVELLARAVAPVCQQASVPCTPLAGSRAPMGDTTEASR